MTRILSSLALVLLFPAFVFSQLRFSSFKDSRYYFEELTLDAGDSKNSYVEILVQLSTDHLQFIKSENGFSASYAMTVSILNSSLELVTTKIFQDTISVESFERIDKPRRDTITQFIFLLEPGNYLAMCKIIDQ